MIRPKGLGRGLDALLAGTDEEAPAAPAQGLRNVPIEHLRPGRYQPRTRLDETALDELAASIREQGVMQPILVRPLEAGRYEIVAGERRFRAAQRAGLKEIPVLVKELADRDALALALIENIQREDLNPLEEARGLKRLIDEFGLTHEAAARAVGRSRSAVTNLLRLMELAPAVQEQLMAQALEMGHARALLALGHAAQVQAAARVVEERLSVRQTETLVQSLLQPVLPGASTAPRRPAREGKDADTARLETELADLLGASVRIEPARGGAGRLMIRYQSLDQLDGILERLRGPA